jgi:hypothetical protein
MAMEVPWAHLTPRTVASILGQKALAPTRSRAVSKMTPAGEWHASLCAADASWHREKGAWKGGSYVMIEKRQDIGRARVPL